MDILLPEMGTGLGFTWIMTKVTTEDDFYPHEKHEKNDYILLLK